MLNPTEYDFLVRDTIIACDGFVARAAKALGVSSGSLYYNLSTQRQREWWRATKAKLYSPKARAQRRSRRYYVRKRTTQAVEGLLSPEDTGSNGGTESDM